MNKIKLLIITVIFSLLITIPVIAKTDNPSQDKKQNSESNPSQGKKPDKETAPGLMRGTTALPSPPSGNPDLLKGQKAKDKRGLKIDIDNLKDILEKIGSKSAGLGKDNRYKHFIKVELKNSSGSGQTKRRAVSGIISEISNGIITLTHFIQRDRIFTILTDDKTIVTIKDNPDAKISDLIPGMRISAVGKLDEKGEILAKRIHAIPGLAIGPNEKYPFSTPSGLITTPSETTPSGLITTPPETTPSEVPSVTTTPTETLTPTPTI